MEGVRTRFYKLTRLIHRELGEMPDLDRRKQLLHDLKFICIAYDILSDPVTRTDYDLRTMGLRGADVMVMPDDKKGGGEMGQRLHLKIGELLNVAGLLETSELEIACDMHKAMPEMQFGSFLVKQGFIEEYQLQAVLFAQKLLRKGLITVVQYIAAMEELESSGVGVSETVVERGYVTQSDLDHLEEEEAEAQAMRTSQPVYTQPALAAPRDEQVSSNTNLLAQMLPPGALDSSNSRGGNGEKAPSMLSKLLAGAEEASQSGTPTTMKDLLKKAGETGATEAIKRKHVETKEEPVVEVFDEPITGDFASSTYVGKAYKEDLLRGGSTDEISRYSDSTEHETFIEKGESEFKKAALSRTTDDTNDDENSGISDSVQDETLESEKGDGDGDGDGNIYKAGESESDKTAEADSLEVSVEEVDSSSESDENTEMPGHVFEDGGLLGGEASLEEASSDELDAVDSMAGDDAEEEEEEEEVRQAAAARASVDVAINIDIDSDDDEDDNDDHDEEEEEEDDEGNITLIDADGADLAFPGDTKNQSSKKSGGSEGQQKDQIGREKTDVTHDRMPAYALSDKANSLIDLDQQSGISPTSELDSGISTKPTAPGKIDPSLVTTRDRMPAFRNPLQSTFQLDESAKTAEEAIEGEDLSGALTDTDESASNLVISNAVPSWKDQLDWSSPENAEQSVTSSGDSETIDITRNLDLEAVEPEEGKEKPDTLESFLGGESLEDAGELNELGRPLWDVEDDEFILPPKKKRMSATADNMNAAPIEDSEELHGKERKSSSGWQRLKNPFELQVEKGQAGDRRRRIQATSETTGEEEPVTAELFQDQSAEAKDEEHSSRPDIDIELPVDEPVSNRAQIDIGLEDTSENIEFKSARLDFDIELPKDQEVPERPDIDIELPKQEASEQIGRPDIDIELPKVDDDAELSDVVSELNETIDEVAADLKKEFRAALREAQATTIPPNDQERVESIVDVQVSLESEGSVEAEKPVIEIELPEVAAPEAPSDKGAAAESDESTAGDTNDASASGHAAADSLGGRRRRPPSQRHHRKKD